MHTRTLSLVILTSTLAWSGIFLTQTDAGAALTARMLQAAPSSAQIPWVFLTEEDMTKGVTIPANTNVVFSLPQTLSPNIYENIDTLLGGDTNTTRYWGYCFPMTGYIKTDKARQGLPGDIFLSVAEQKARADAAKKSLTLNFFQAPKAPVDTTPGSSLIHNQRLFFKPGETCYIMTAKPLSAGVDTDGDLLNSKLETVSKTDPENADTDGDGIPDGTEVLTGHTNPLSADTDGDGLPDGTEDKNHNGIVDAGETNPRARDTDGDGLCDGYCRLQLTQYSVCPTTKEELARGFACITIAPHWFSYSLDPNDDNPEDLVTTYQDWFAGEDKNLNGMVDSGETDPLKVATNGVTNDLEIYLKCVLKETQEGAETISC